MKGFAKEEGKLFALRAFERVRGHQCEGGGGGRRGSRASVFTPKGVRSAGCVPRIHFFTEKNIDETSSQLELFEKKGPLGFP